MVQPRLFDRPNKQIAVTKNAWINYRTAEQKFSTDLIALKARGDLYKSRIRSGIPSPVAVEQDQKATFELYQLLTADCHALNSSRYQLVLEVREVSRLFSYQWRNFDNLGRSASCEFFADMAEKLRYFSDDPIPSRDKLDQEVKQLDEGLKKLETNIANFVAAPEQLDRMMDEAFIKLESKSVTRRIIDCF